MTYICVGNKILAGDHKVRALSIEHDLSGLEFMQPYWPSAVNMIPRLHQTRQVSRHTLLRSSIFLGFRREGPPSIRSYKHYQVIKVLNWLDWTFTRKSCQSSHSSSLSHLSSSFASPDSSMFNLNHSHRRIGILDEKLSPSYWWKKSHMEHSSGHITTAIECLHIWEMHDHKCLPKPRSHIACYRRLLQ